jgi:CheY-like chemotaxis protein
MCPVSTLCNPGRKVTSRASVLIAEDDYNFAETLEDALVEDAHVVLVARNGVEGLAALGRIPRPALVLLDLHMPVMDGVTFLNHLRSRGDRDEFEVVIMSAVVDPQWFAKLPGVVRALRKPFNIEEIQTLVSEFGERRPMARSGRGRRTGA